MLVLSDDHPMHVVHLLRHVSASFLAVGERHVKCRHLGFYAAEHGVRLFLHLCGVLVKTKAVDGNAARWIAIGASIIAGVFAGLASGVPSEPAAWVTCVFATIGGVQIAYTAFKASGVTSKWLDALLAVGSIEGRK